MRSPWARARWEAASTANYTKGRGASISRIVIHDMEGSYGGSSETMTRLGHVSVGLVLLSLLTLPLFHVGGSLSQALAALSGGDPVLDRQIERAARLVNSPVSLLITGDDNTLMNKLAIAVQGDGGDRDQRPETADPTRKKAAPQSHIRAARPRPPDAKIPEKGPMADMLAKVFGKKDGDPRD